MPNLEEARQGRFAKAYQSPNATVNARLRASGWRYAPAMASALAFRIHGAVTSGASATKFVVPKIEGHVTDTATRLTPAEKNALDGKLSDYRACSTNEIAIFIPSSLEGETVEDVAYTTFNTWHVGRAKDDNGVLFVWAPTERKTRIETGKGVGGALTDVQSSRILRALVHPRFAKDEAFAGLDEGTTAIARALGGCEVESARSRLDSSNPLPAPRFDATSTTATPPPTKPAPSALEEALMIGVVPFGFVVVLFVIIYGALRDVALIAAFPFAMTGATVLAFIGYGISDSAIVPPLVCCGGFFGILLPLWRVARKRHGKRGAGGTWSWAGGSSSSGSSTSSYSSSASSSSASSSSASSSSSGSTSSSSGSGYSGGGGSSGGGGASGSY